MVHLSPDQIMLIALLFSLLLVHCLSKTQNSAFDLKFLEKLKSTTKSGYIDLNQEQFKKFSLVDHTSRDFHLFVLFTSLDPSMGCAACPEAAQSYRHLISIFERKAKKGPLPVFFANIEFKNNMEAFQMAGVDKIPTFAHFGPKAFAPNFLPPGAATDVTKLIEFIAKETNSEINIEEAFKPEPNHNGLIALITGVAIIGGLVATKTISLQSIYQNVYLWSAFVLAFTITMMTGYMWVKIRKVPFVGTTNGRDVSYVMRALTQQFGIESRIIAGLVFASSLLFLSVPFIASRFEGKNKRQVAAFVGVVAYMAAHAGLMKVFSMKAPGYPLSHIF